MSPTPVQVQPRQINLDGLSGSGLKRVGAVESQTLCTNLTRVAKLPPFEGGLRLDIGTIRFYNDLDRDLTITSVNIYVDTPPSGSSIAVDINKGGSTIFTDPTYRPMILSGSYSGSTTTIGTSTWYRGEYLTMDIDTVGSTNSGRSLVTSVVCREI